MFKDIELYNPDFIINCANLNTSGSIYEIMRNMGPVTSYVYGMCYRKSLLTFDFIKVGRSNPELGTKREYQVGERIIRQAASLKGWNEPRRLSGHGAEFWANIEAECIPTGIIKADLTKNDLVIAVWDISKRMAIYNSCLWDEDRATFWAEGELADQYTAKFGKLPPLNFKDPARNLAYRTGYIPEEVAKLFQLT